MILAEHLLEIFMLHFLRCRDSTPKPCLRTVCWAPTWHHVCSYIFLSAWCFCIWFSDVARPDNPQTPRIEGKIWRILYSAVKNFKSDGFRSFRLDFSVHPNPECLSENLSFPKFHRCGIRRPRRAMEATRILIIGQKDAMSLGAGRLQLKQVLVLNKSTLGIA